MTQRPVVKVITELYVDTGRPVSAKSFHARARALMDELIKLDGYNPDIIDPTVSSDAGRCVMEVEALVATDDPLDAVTKMSGVLRTALHAAGASTPAWNEQSVVRTENSTERVGYLAAC